MLRAIYIVLALAIVFAVAGYQLRRSHQGIAQVCFGFAIAFAVFLVLMVAGVI